MPRRQCMWSITYISRTGRERYTNVLPPTSTADLAAGEWTESTIPKSGVPNVSTNVRIV